MEQYYRLFTSYRYPGIKQDDTVTKDMSELAESAHAIVACNDQFYKLELLQDGRRLEDEEIYNQLRRITHDAATNRETVLRVGSLTALPRPRWAKVREHMATGTTLLLV
ncbi:unnamed protein product [Dibothriocephalus latus]|uniref:Choline/carnitine acyltransferase domain-containing protein n=1 Tax=Dibothriocephalus latus TaxID=60516 RepID=A0A3P7P876_DIBLA|nr:unnamed protein product [Dibothriocephalus latus]